MAVFKDTRKIMLYVAYVVLIFMINSLLVFIFYLDIQLINKLRLSSKFIQYYNRYFFVVSVCLSAAVVLRCRATNLANEVPRESS